MLLKLGERRQVRWVFRSLASRASDVVFERGAVAIGVGDGAKVARRIVFHAGGVAGGSGLYLIRSYTSDDFAVGVSLVPRSKSRIASGPT